MKYIHVCLVSDQPIPNLTTSLQFKPDTVVLFTTKEMKEKAELLENVLKNKGFSVKSETIEAYDINNVIDVSESLINECKDSEVTLNITGGTKIGTLGTFQAFYTKDKTIFYVDTKNNKILKLFPEKEQEKYHITVSISIKDYLALYGFMVSSYVKDDGYIQERKELTNYLAHIACYKPNIIRELNYNLHNYNEKSSLPIVINISIDDRLCNLIGLLNNVTRKGKDKVEILNYNDLRYLKGIWFEEYTYLLAKGLDADEVWLNVFGKWVTKGKHPPKNEFDVLIAKGTRLFYISCKTGNLNRKMHEDDEGIGREYLYELDSIGDTALGLFGKRMLASARKIEDPFVRERAKILNIDIADGRDVITLREKLRQWLSKRY